MLRFALNHMTVPSLTAEALFALADGLGCVGVELRNDLDAPLFDGKAPQTAAALAARHSQAIFAVSEVKAFNDFSDAKLADAIALMDIAKACGAKAITLIPRVGGATQTPDDRRAGLRTAISRLRPELARRGLTGLIEPIGFATSTLRHKAEVVAEIEEQGARDHIRLVHDTFHHHLAGGGPVFPDHTGLVHVSGVTDSHVATGDLQDAHRVLVDGQDRLGNIAQITALLRGGYEGPISIEAFSPDIHALSDPKDALSRSIHFIETSCTALAA